MFTGIIQGTAKIIQITGSTKLKTFRVKFPSLKLNAVQVGASIALNGTCLTVTKFDLECETANFDVIDETLSLTNLADIKANDYVNFERASRLGDEIGGHITSGHIHCTTEVIGIQKDDENCTISFKSPSEFLKYLLPKGFASINGCSLTLGEVNESVFRVHLIPETLRSTTFGNIKLGDKVNLEIDSQTQTIVDTVERVLLNSK